MRWSCSRCCWPREKTCQSKDHSSTKFHSRSFVSTTRMATRLRRPTGSNTLRTNIVCNVFRVRLFFSAPHNPRPLLPPIGSHLSYGALAGLRITSVVSVPVFGRPPERPSAQRVMQSSLSEAVSTCVHAFRSEKSQCLDPCCIALCLLASWQRPAPRMPSPTVLSAPVFCLRRWRPTTPASPTRNHQSQRWHGPKRRMSRRLPTGYRYRFLQADHREFRRHVQPGLDVTHQPDGTLIAGIRQFPNHVPVPDPQRSRA